jgi:hypothetical protein
MDDNQAGKNEEQPVKPLSKTHGFASCRQVKIVDACNVATLAKKVCRPKPDFAGYVPSNIPA